ncbi:hypothetical protein BKA59DRAFT_13361 [Fusarium tricinctum]|uniref:Uncharacterized protein n=2 Tax=Fusarium tricinctum species complex TaxID=679429 RepID=A0A8K0WGS6_9HYPO|nr:hypothetical protein BKA59DRAFT_13361 [Fusarium tricinctum]
MCESRTAQAARQWGDSPSKAPRHQSTTASGSTPTATATATAATLMFRENLTSTRQQISPPSSPSASSSASAFQPIQPQSIDVLASQLGSSSLDHYRYNSYSSTTTLPEVALSPISLPDEDCVNVQSMLSQHNLGSMKMDADYNNITMVSQNTSEHPICSINMPFNTPSIAVDPAALAEDSGHVSMPTFRPNLNGGFEVDEGYCEDDDDFSWLQQPLAPRRAAGTSDGVKKRYDLGYRRSADAASRCRNTIHSVPRMRRRDKKKSRSLHSAASSVRSRSDSLASQLVAATQQDS